LTEVVAVVDPMVVVARLAVVVLLIHEAVVVDPIFEVEVVGLTFEAEAVLVEALVAVGNKGGKLSTCTTCLKACC
jgi:hypothetical protein